MWVSETVLVDTGAWLALFDSAADGHDAMLEVADLIELGHLIVPWPVAYETLRTRFVRRPAWVSAFNERLSQPSVTFVDDVEYCREAYSLTINSALIQQRDLSMVDVMCRMMIGDRDVDIKYLLTVNRKDFYDVCAANRVEIYP